MKSSSQSLIILLLLVICVCLLKNNSDLRSILADIKNNSNDNYRVNHKGIDASEFGQQHRSLKGKHERLPWSDDDRRKAIKSMMDFPSMSSSRDMDKRICDSNITCLDMAGKHNIPENVGGCIYRESQKSVLVNGKILSYYDILKGTEILRDYRGTYSTTTYNSIALQQDPSDAFAIGDLLWRVRPRLLIELGTSGGGSALFWARSMRGYDPYAHVITIDPANGPDYLDGVPLRNWNWKDIEKFCPHCLQAKDESLWEHHVTFLRKIPTSEEALDFVKKKVELVVSQGFAVMVIEDSNHLYSSVNPNIDAYHSFVTPGSYLIVQDTRGGAFDWSRFGPCKAVNDFMKRQDYSKNVDRSQVPVFVRDRRPEVFLYSQHSGGFMRRLENNESPAKLYDELI